VRAARSAIVKVCVPEDVDCCCGCDGAWEARGVLKLVDGAVPGANGERPP
jgi:hypothetical protein